MPDFNHTEPPKRITDPNGLGHHGDYPANTYRAVTVEKDSDGKPLVPDGVLIVAWQGRTPVYNEVRAVADASARKVALAEGFTDGPDVSKADKLKPKGDK